VLEDARGRPSGTLDEREEAPVPGEDLWITLDADLQAFAESLLADYGSGAFVALDARSGEVLVLASQPSFDPNIFAVAVPPILWDSLSNDPLHPLLNRAVQATFPPGSTFKPITATAGLRSGLVDPGTRLLPCFGAYRFGRRVFHCWELEGHGSLRLDDAIAQSCDVYFYQIGAKMDLDRFADISRQCGFGSPTGIDLPGERDGLIPDSKYMNNRYGRSGWGQGFLLNHSIGQGEILTTPLQIARFYAGLGSSRLISPRILYESVDAEGVSTSHAPPVSEPLPIESDELSSILRGLTLVVEGERGTGRAARLAGIETAGKTGTAENPHGEDHAWYAAWAPAKHPRIALAVIVENAGHGGDIAAPMVGQFLRYFFGREGGV